MEDLNKHFSKEDMGKKHMKRCLTSLIIVFVQLLSHVQLFVTPCQTPLSSTVPWSLLSSGSCPVSRWCYPTISSSAALFCFCFHSFPASGSFPFSWLFASGSQSIGASASVLPMNIQGWFPFGLTDLLAVHRNLKSLLQYQNLKAPLLYSHNGFDLMNSLIIREMQIKTTIRHHHTPVRMAII